MRPSTLNRSLKTPAMAFSEPFGFDASSILAGGVTIAKRHLPVAFDLFQSLVVRFEIPLAVGDGELDDLTGRVAPGEARADVLDPQMLHPADEALSGVSHQNARQEAGLAENLEAVADAEHQLRPGPHGGRPPA